MEIVNNYARYGKQGISVGETYFIEEEIFLVVQDDAGDNTLYRLMSFGDCSLGETVYDSLTEIKICNPDMVPVKSKIVFGE